MQDVAKEEKDNDSQKKISTAKHPKQDHVDKVLELSNKLGVSAKPGDAFLSSKKEIV